MQPSITTKDFEKIELRIGTIIEVNDFIKAKKPAYKLTIDFGSDIGIKKSSAQITELYSKEDLLNRQIIAVVNFLPKQIANFISECLVLGATLPNNKVVILQPERTIENGCKIS